MTPRRPVKRPPRWRCLICGAHGRGPIELWRRHYLTAHYVDDGGPIDR